MMRSFRVDAHDMYTQTSARSVCSEHPIQLSSPTFSFPSKSRCSCTTGTQSHGGDHKTGRTWPTTITNSFLVSLENEGEDVDDDDDNDDKDEGDGAHSYICTYKCRRRRRRRASQVKETKKSTRLQHSDVLPDKLQSIVAPKIAMRFGPKIEKCKLLMADDKSWKRRNN